MLRNLGKSKLLYVSFTVFEIGAIAILWYASMVCKYASRRVIESVNV